MSMKSSLALNLGSLDANKQYETPYKASQTPRDPIAGQMFSPDE
jgi:hypothetical protein